MKVYEAESSIKNLILNNKIKSYCLIKPKESKIPIDKPDFFPSKASLEDWDLFRFDSVLASSCWNDNDDIFLPEELWAARHTILHKPLNIDHQESEIIGHVYDSYVLDSAGQLYTGQGCPSELFDLCSSSVIYKVKEDESLQGVIDDIMNKIEARSIYVSMECLFYDFDYGLIDNKGNQQVILRDKSSAHLSKYLRVYGGIGVYDNHRIGRVLRNPNFSAHGIVEQPANQRSVILFSSASIKKGKNEMSEDRVKELETQVAELTKQLANTNLVKVEKELSEIKVEKETLVKANEKLSQELDSLKVQKTEVSELYSKAKTELDEEKKAHAELKNSVEKEKTEANRAKRAEALKNAGLKEEEVKVKVERFEKLDDEAFAEMVTLYSGTNKQTEETIVATATSNLNKTEVVKEAPLHDKNVELTLSERVANILKVKKGE